MIWAVLGFLFSMLGLLCVLIGIVLFLTMPLISTVSRFKRPADFFLSLATYPISRAAVVVSEHNDLMFKQMRFDGLGVEEIPIDGVDKLIEDPDNALHYFLGMRFLLVDEEHGVGFDPRHAAAGMRKRYLDQRDEGSFMATEEEWEEFGVKSWKPGVFEMPKAHELVDLSAVQELIDGGERSEYPERIENIYENSRRPFWSGTSVGKFLYPVIALAITFGGTWFMISQFGLPFAGGSGGPDRTVGYGLLYLLLSSFGIDYREVAKSTWEKLKTAGRTVVAKTKAAARWLAATIRAIDWNWVFAMFCFITIPLAVVYGLYSVFGTFLTVAILFATGVGFITPIFFTVITRPSKILSGAFSNLYFKLGFFGYRQPIVVWTPSKYVVREESQLETTEDINYYDLWGHVVGFSYTPGKESWEAEYHTPKEIEAQQPVADGGDRISTNLPGKYVRSEQIKRDIYGGYIPRRVDSESYYISSGIATERFTNSANGEKGLKKLLESKDIHGADDGGLDDAMVFKTTIVSGVIGLITALAIFVLPAFL